MGAEPKHGHAAARAYAEIKAGILRNLWPDGAHLREQELAEHLGVSRTPVRDALRRLASEGLVEIETHVGCRVRGWKPADIDEIFGLRAELEGYAARRAATRLDPAALAELEDLCHRMEEAILADVDDPARRERIAPLNERFHAIILEAAQNDRLAGLVRQVVSIPLVLRTFARYEPAEIRRSMAQHRELLEAFRAREPGWAEAVMRAHIHAGHAVMKRAVAAAVEAGGDGDRSD
ncbi:MAG: GntR family transcriptional regulator [Alphaproteobacteria bacterium]|nr:GntR family transcriptional regulator [Alphaproteobacteria bacterium]MDX5367786.1 GntR family transcriptional regulator [Alphaproteobacteria bacterium]MDX5462672.1 GntR family transcriptional regulator [Alphaproteobacteria bacterium]